MFLYDFWSRGVNNTMKTLIEIIDLFIIFDYVDLIIRLYCEIKFNKYYNLMLKRVDCVELIKILKISLYPNNKFNR